VRDHAEFRMLPLILIGGRHTESSCVVREIGDDVSDDQFDWRRAWAEARANRVANAPRRAALREALEATKPLKGQPAEQIRATLQREAAARGIADLTPRQLDLLVEAVMTSPRRTILRAAVRGLKAVRQVFSEAEAHLMPTWTLPPDGTASLDWRQDQEDVPTTVELDPDAADVIARLFGTSRVSGDRPTSRKRICIEISSAGCLPSRATSPSERSRCTSESR
jgi:hypothetical protein